MKLLYLESTMWEFDFIVNDILYNIKKDVEFFNKINFKQLLNRTDIIENNILVINNICNFYDIINVVKHIKPIVIFYMSDELGNEPHITILENHTKLLFRQYNHPKYNYSKNNYQLPLGYSKFFLNNTKSIDIKTKKINQRTINCSFIGTPKSDRIQMTNIFKNNMKNTNFIFVNNNWDINNLPYSPQKCFEIYNNSIFVICGRGNASLDCFRIYETIVAGAIPVIVGSNKEIENTFNYNNNIPPFIYENSWERVVIKCNDLLNNYEKLQEIQNNLLLWWNNQILLINNLIIKEII
jgi:hypothetical protein